MARNGFEPAPTEIRVADQTVFDSGPLVNVEGFDPVDLLPERAADKLRALRQRAADLHMLVPAFEQVQDVSLERIKVERELKRLTDAASDGGFNLPATDPRVNAAQTRLDKLTAEAARLAQMREARSAAWQTTARVLSNVETWLRSGRPGNTVLLHHEGEAPALSKGEDVLAALERVRRRGRELQADAHRIRSSPFLSSEAKRRAREQVLQLAQRGAPNVAGLIEYEDGEIAFPRTLLKVQMHNIPQAPAAVGYAEVIDPVATLAWLFGDALIKRIDAAIDAESDDKNAMSHEAREKAEAQVMADLLAVERDECSLVWMAMEQKLPVEFRADTNPAAILSVRLVTAPNVERPGTSWMHGADLVGR